MPPLSIMIKPASGNCNLRCKYCFYSDVTSNRQCSNMGFMSDSTSERLIKSALSFANSNSVVFAFQGGEPLLAGLDYFRNFTQKVKEYNVKNSNIFFSIQTNGTLINREWAEFFFRNKFLVGLSLDGNFKGNKFRIDKKGQNTYFKITSSAKILKSHNVEFNILTVLTGFCAENAENIYKYFRDNGFHYLQFTPCLRPFGDKSENEMYMTNSQYADFLIKVFNLYVKDFVRGNYVSIRQFDNYVRMYLGENPEQCGMCGHCMHQFVAEGNGNIYPCDFYCTDEWLLGNINDTHLSQIANSEKAIQFIKESLSVKDECKNCKFYPLCRGGGCKRQKIDNNYCQAYKTFFSSTLPLFRMFK